MLASGAPSCRRGQRRRQRGDAVGRAAALERGERVGRRRPRVTPIGRPSSSAARPPGAATDLTQRAARRQAGGPRRRAAARAHLGARPRLHARAGAPGGPARRPAPGTRLPDAASASSTTQRGGSPGASTGEREPGHPRPPRSAASSARGAVYDRGVQPRQRAAAARAARRRREAATPAGLREPRACSDGRGPTARPRGEPREADARCHQAGAARSGGDADRHHDESSAWPAPRAVRRLRRPPRAAPHAARPACAAAMRVPDGQITAPSLRTGQPRHTDERRELQEGGGEHAVRPRSGPGRSPPMNPGDAVSASRRLRRGSPATIQAGEARLRRDRAGVSLGSIGRLRRAGELAEQPREIAAGVALEQDRRDDRVPTRVTGPAPQASSTTSTRLAEGQAGGRVDAARVPPGPAKRRARLARSRPSPSARHRARQPVRERTPKAPRPTSSR